MKDARPTIRDLRFLIRKPGAGQRPDRPEPEAAEAQRARRRGLPALGQGAAEDRSRSSSTSARTRPEFVGWLTKFGQGAVQLRRQRPLRAHPAALQRLPVHVSAADRPACSRPSRPAQRLAGPRDRQGRPLPGRRDPARARRLEPVARHRRRPRLRPRPPCRPAHEADRAIVLLAGLGLAALLVVFGTGAGEDDGAGYEVRAIFDNAAYVGEGRGREDRGRASSAEIK